jgi:potassium-transporting ATPase KdpC subunit
MRREMITSTIAIVVLTVLLGVIYPLVLTGVGQAIFPGAANGSRLEVNGRLVGSKLIGQQFGDVAMKRGKPELDKNGNPVTTPDPRYFQSRPSATTPSENAAGSSFSNLGPNDGATREAIEEHIKGYLALERPYVPDLTVAEIPVDAVNSSASGLDPEISLANARIQAHRVAAVRRLALARVIGLIAKYTTGRTLGVFGEPGVNVLELNLALNRLMGGH